MCDVSALARDVPINKKEPSGAMFLRRPSVNERSAPLRSAPHPRRPQAAPSCSTATGRLVDRSSAHVLRETSLAQAAPSCSAATARSGVSQAPCSHPSGVLRSAGGVAHAPLGCRRSAVAGVASLNAVPHCPPTLRTPNVSFADCPPNGRNKATSIQRYST